MTTEVGLDIETTGLERGDHRIIEVYAGIWVDGVFKGALNKRIDPERQIAADAQRVHGISYQDLIGMPKWPAVAPDLQKVMAIADRYIWHNGDDFDGPFIEYEMNRIGMIMPKKPAIDTMKLGTWATADGKKPTLQELSFACEVEYDPAKAHAADYDVHRMMECYLNARQWGYFRIEEGTSLAA